MRTLQVLTILIVSAVETKFALVAPDETTKNHGSKINSQGLLCDASLLHGGKYKFYSPCKGWLDHAYDLRSLWGKKGSYLPDSIAWYSEAPEDSKIYLISFAGKCFFAGEIIFRTLESLCLLQK